jgi:hypothetical protein
MSLPKAITQEYEISDADHHEVGIADDCGTEVFHQQPGGQT